MDDKIKTIADYYGLTNQKHKLREEMNELMEAIQEGEPGHIAEEMADVLIMIEQMRYFFDIGGEEVAACMDYKKIRTLEKIRRNNG